MSCLRSYDDLCEALEAYEAADFDNREDAWLALLRASKRCGLSGNMSVANWARQRVKTYRQTFDTPAGLDGAVAHLNAVITSLEIAQ